MPFHPYMTSVSTVIQTWKHKMIPNGCDALGPCGGRWPRPPLPTMWLSLVTARLVRGWQKREDGQAEWVAAWGKLSMGDLSGALTVVDTFCCAFENIRGSRQVRAALGGWEDAKRTAAARWPPAAAPSSAVCRTRHPAGTTMARSHRGLRSVVPARGASRRGRRTPMAQQWGSTSINTTWNTVTRWWRLWAKAPTAKWRKRWREQGWRQWVFSCVCFNAMLNSFLVFCVAKLRCSTRIHSALKWGDKITTMGLSFFCHTSQLGFMSQMIQADEPNVVPDYFEESWGYCVCILIPDSDLSTKRQIPHFFWTNTL